jgi:hypothetical protein
MTPPFINPAPMISPVLLGGLSGYVVVHDAIKGDYPVIECARSLIPVCDEVLIADADSTDGTLQMLTRFAAMEPKVRVVSIPWPKLPTYEEYKADAPRPMNDNKFWPILLNTVRPMLRYQSQIHLDADEILFPCAYDEVRRAVADGSVRYLERLNFWQDAHHRCPEGWVCGTYVAKLGPSTLWCPSDEHWPDGEPEMRQRATKHESLKVGHYGFLRKQDGFYAKSKVMQPAVVGNYDARLEEAERTGRNWWELSTFPAELVPYDGGHPDTIILWLNERGRL